MGSPPNKGTPNAGWVFRLVKYSPAQTPYRRKFVSIRTVARLHDGALAEEYAVLSTTLVAVEVR